MPKKILEENEDLSPDGSKSEISEEVNLTEFSEENFENIKLQLKDAIDQKQRALAEGENTRKRASRDIEQNRKYGHISFSRELLEIYDNLDRAVSSIPKNKDELSEEIKNFIIGVEMTLEQIKQIFNNNSITQINPINEKFDYNFHQAMYESETDKFEPGIVIEVMQKGWLLHDRLLRPAMVGVSKKLIGKKD